MCVKNILQPRDREPTVRFQMEQVAYVRQTMKGAHPQKKKKITAHVLVRDLFYISRTPLYFLSLSCLLSNINYLKESVLLSHFDSYKYSERNHLLG